MSTINLARTPADQARATRHIEVDGVGRVEVSPEFFALSPAQQQQAVEEIRQYHQGQQPPQAAQQPPQEPFREATPTDLVMHIMQPAVNFGRSALQGAAHVMDNGAETLESGYNNTLGRVFGETHQTHDLDHPQEGQPRGGFQGLTDRLGHSTGPVDTAGHATGEIGMSALLTRNLPGAFLPGAASGALMSDAQTPSGVAVDAVTGGIGGKLTNALLNGVSSIVAPRIASGARTLWDMGVRRMTPGQVAPALRRTEERMMSRPHVGDTITQGRQASYQDFNRTAIHEVVAPYNAVSTTAPIRVPAQGHGTSVIRSVGDQLSNRYERLVPKLTLHPDQQLGADIQALSSTLSNGDLTPAAVDQFEAIIRNQVMPRLNGAQPMTGEAYRQVERGLSRQIARFGRSSDPDHQALAGAFGEVQSAFQSALQRSNPQFAAELAALNESWANLVRVEGAAAGAKGGLFSPLQFRQAVRRADNSTRDRAMARGEARMQDLAEAAVDVLPSAYPDSGTSGRQQMSFSNPNYWIGLLQGQIYRPEVQQGLTNALMYPRPAAAQSVAELLRALPAPQAGAAAGNALISPLLRPTP